MDFWAEIQFYRYFVRREKFIYFSIGQNTMGIKTKNYYNFTNRM